MTVWGWGLDDTFPKDVSPKANVIVGQEFELAYFGATLKHVNYYSMRTSSA